MMQKEKSTVNIINLVSKSYEILGDLETPVSAFYKLCKSLNTPYSILLESVEKNEKIGRYSILGFDPLYLLESKNNVTTLTNKKYNTSITLEENPFEALDHLIKSIKINDSKSTEFIGFYGYFGFENVRWIEPSTGFQHNKDKPDVILMLPGKLLVFDHIARKINFITVGLAETTEADLEEELKTFQTKLKHSIEAPSLAFNFSENTLAPFESNLSKQEYMDMVTSLKKYIHSGDIFQIVPSQKMRVKGTYDGFTLYRILRSVNPSPYLFYLDFNTFQLAGSSPEIMTKCERINDKRIVSIRPIAGTYPRGQNETEDLKNIESLKNDTKEKAEHLMLVDLARNDLGKVCETGSIKVSELMTIEKYSHIFHMVSLVQGVLKKESSCIDLLAACLPHGTLSGAPKIRAMQLIKQFEKDQRGPYGGCLGFFGLNDTINTCITIRTMVINKDFIEIQAGGGVVADSDPENEYLETLRKASALLKTINLVDKL